MKHRIMEIENVLQNIGFNKSQIVIFLALLKSGTSFPPDIALNTGITRTNCYAILNSLADAGVVQEVEIKKRKAYRANDPESVLQFIEQKKIEAKEALPQLYNLYSMGDYKPRVRYLDKLKEIEIELQKIIQDDQFRVMGNISILSSLGISLPQAIIEIINNTNYQETNNYETNAISIITLNIVIYIIIGEQTTATIIENRPIANLLSSTKP